jgi:hypothetical protein
MVSSMGQGAKKSEITNGDYFSWPSESVSFTDDTSPDTRNTKERNVSIHAKVRRETPLDWYYDLIYLCRNIKGELKSKDAVKTYKNMRRYERAKLWDTLKEVQINITDPLPYQVRTNSIRGFKL